MTNMIRELQITPKAKENKASSFRIVRARRQKYRLLHFALRMKVIANEGHKAYRKAYRYCMSHHDVATIVSDRALMLGSA